MMNATMIGVDAHKRSHTAVVLDDNEEIDDQIKVVADRRQVDLLLAWAARWPDRVWAIENATGSGGCWLSGWSPAGRWWWMFQAG